MLAAQSGGQAIVLVVLAADVYVRNIVSSGALDDLRATVRIAASDRNVRHRDDLLRDSRFAGFVADPVERVRPYGRLELIVRAGRRHRSRTLALKHKTLPRHHRILSTIASLPGLRRLARRILLAQAGENPAMRDLLEREKPDLLLLPTGGNDVLVNDAIRTGRRLGIPTLALQHNWDGLSSKGALAVLPDHLAVWGEQSFEHATRIVRMPTSCVHTLGSPSLDQYVHYVPESRPSPFPFPYVLFAGCYAPFDEREAVAALDREVQAQGDGTRLVYRPHPFRARRTTPDRVDQASLQCTIIDPSVRATYEASFSEYETGKRPVSPQFPELVGYPALLEHARIVVTPLSTMLLEAALLGRPILALAYDDGIHVESPSRISQYEHFAGLDAVPGITFVREQAELDDAFHAALKRPVVPDPSTVQWWVATDERSYAERLADSARACMEPSGHPDHTVRSYG